MIKSLIMKISCATLILLVLGTFFSFNVYADEVIQGFDYDNFYQLDYISSDGYQSLNTGVYASSSVWFDISIQFNSSSKNMMLGSDSSGSFSPMLTHNIIRPCTDKELRRNMSLNEWHTVAFGSSFVSIDGQSYTYSSTDYNASGNIFLFHRPIDNEYGVGKFKYVRIYNDSNMVRNLIPAQRKSDSVVGMYDCINHYFYTNQGSGQFTYGSIVSPVTYTISFSGYNNGSVTGYGEYSSGTQATLTATPDSGYLFSGWSDGSTSNPYTFTVTSDLIINPIFTLVPETDNFTISAASNNNNFGYVNGGGTFASGTTIELTAVPNEGYIFTKWSDNNTSNPRNITVTQNLTLQAIFTPLDSPVTLPFINTVASPSFGGSVNGGGYYPVGTTIELTAVPSNGYVFTQWSDGLKVNPRSVTVTDDETFTAYFTMPVYYPFDEFSYDPNEVKPFTGKLYNLLYQVQKRRVIDNTFSAADYLKFGHTGSGNINVQLVGSYYDNTLTGVSYCNGVDVTTDTSSNVNSFYDWLVNNGLSVYTSNGVMLLAHSSGGGGPISPPSGMGSSVSVEQMGCKLLATDGKTNVLEHLEELGYVKKPIDISDGGYAETYVYVPGNESITLNVSNLGAFVSDMFDKLYAHMSNKYLIEYHYEKDLLITADEKTVFPDHGKLSYSVPWWVFGDVYNWQKYLSNDNTNIFRMKLKSTNGVYDGYYFNITWSGLDHIEITYESDHYLLLNDDNTYVPSDTIANRFLHNDWFNTGTSYGGNLYDKQIDDYGSIELRKSDLYYSVSPTLGLFNSLGKFLNDWFNRIYLNMGSGGGGSSSDVIIENEVNNNYNVNISNDIHDLIHDVNTGIDDINPLITDNELSDDHKTGLGALGSALLEPVFGLFFDSGLGYMLIIPLVLLLLGLIL